MGVTAGRIYPQKRRSCCRTNIHLDVAILYMSLILLELQLILCQLQLHMHIHLTESITQLLEHADIQPDTFVAIIIIAIQEVQPACSLQLYHELYKPGLAVASELHGSNVTADAVASREVIISFKWRLIIIKPTNYTIKLYAV